MPSLAGAERAHASAPRNRRCGSSSRLRTLPRPARASSRAPAGDRVARLVGSAAAGEDHGWTGLVKQFDRVISAVARSHRLSDADAADVSQETWLRLLENIDGLREPARIGGWLATTARRQCLRVIRSSDRQVPAGDGLADHAAPSAPPDSELIAAERNADLWRAFHRLRPSDQQLLHLLVDDSETGYREISTRLQMPIGSIGPTRARALERLRRLLASEGSLTLLAS
jgi:RNA polymerase sigma factor (sigma-70 family)